MMLKIKKGITFIALLITIFVTSISCSSKSITGKYIGNFDTYGMLSNSLTLDCYGNAIMEFSHNIIQKKNSYNGVWKIKNDTLVLFFDSIINKNKKYKGEIKYLLKSNQLIRINRRFDSIKKNIISLCKENNINYKKSIRKMNRNYNKWRGSYDFQSFKKIENTDCAK